MSSGANLLLFVALDSLCQGLCSDAIIGLAGMIGHRFSFLHRPPSTASRGRGVHKFSNCHHSMSSGANLLLFVALDSLCQGLCSDAIIGLAGMIGHRFSFLHRPPSTAS